MANSKATMLFNLILLLSFRLIFNMAESSLFDRVLKKAEKSTPFCVSVYGAQDRDTCFSVAQEFNLTSDFFSQINPNFNCDQIFIGEWLCANGF